MTDPVISITKTENQISIGDGLFVTSTTGFINYRHEFEVNGRKIFIDNILPFSLVKVAEFADIFDCEKDISSKDA